MKKLLWVGDAACPSGFARATHAILDVFRPEFQITVLGMNYRGDPHEYPYPIYAAAPGGDAMGVGRLIWMCDRVQPDVIIVQNDGWNIPFYVQQLRRFKEYKSLPVIAAVAVDGKNFQGDWLKDVAHAIFWTQFALTEAREGGYDGPATVIPLGVDMGTFTPMVKSDVRRRQGLGSIIESFIVGNVNRNQPRKRWDLTLRYFAQWVRTEKIDDAYLFLHCAPTGDTGADVKNLARYYGVLHLLALREPPVFYGLPEATMAETYNCFDVQISTTQGEGFGLTTFEGMACGVPQIVPAWSALGELCQDVALLVPCTSTHIGPPYVNVIGGVADEQQFITALDQVYREPDTRQALREAGLARVAESRFRWENVGREFLNVARSVIDACVEV